MPTISFPGLPGGIQWAVSFSIPLSRNAKSYAVGISLDLIKLGAELSYFPFDLAEDLLARGQLDLAETFIDASFGGGKKGAVQWVQHAAAKLQ
jgi:hypothetical protein